VSIGAQFERQQQRDQQTEQGRAPGIGLRRLARLARPARLAWLARLSRRRRFTGVGRVA
jgi:hypothetical protein